MSIFLLCCTQLFHGVCFHSCLSDNLRPQPLLDSTLFDAKARWLVNRLLVDMRKTTLLLVKWTRRTSVCPTTLTRRGMIDDRLIGSLLRSSPDGPGKRDGYDLLVISQCILFSTRGLQSIPMSIIWPWAQTTIRYLLAPMLTHWIAFALLFIDLFMMVSCIPSEKTSVGRFPSEREPACMKDESSSSFHQPGRKDCRQRGKFN